MRGGEGQIADSLPVFHIQLLYVALASGHIFSPVSELLAKTPFLQIGQLSNPPVTLTKIYINGRGRGERALLHYIILFSIFSICLCATFSFSTRLELSHLNNYILICVEGGEQQFIFLSSDR